MLSPVITPTPCTAEDEGSSGCADIFAELFVAKSSTNPDYFNINTLFINGIFPREQLNFIVIVIKLIFL